MSDFSTCDDQRRPAGDGTRLEHLLQAVREEVMPLFNQLTCIGADSLQTLRRATGMLPPEMETAILRMVEGHLADRAGRLGGKGGGRVGGGAADSFARRFPNVGGALRQVERDLEVSLRAAQQRRAAMDPLDDQQNRADQRKLDAEVDEIDAVILWVLAAAGRPLSHQEIVDAMERDWKWYCDPVVAKTVANHFTHKSLLKELTELGPSNRGRVLNQHGRAWVKNNPARTQPRG